MRRWRRIPSLLLCTIPVAFAGCSDNDNDDGGGGGGWTLAQVAARIDGALEAGHNTIGADAVAALFFDTDPSNDPFLLDVRDAADFARGHVPGSVNVPLREFPRRYAQEGDALIPADKNVVVISYVGGDGNMASLAINAVRITDPANAANLPWSKSVMMGMQAWTFDKLLAAGYRWPDDLGVRRIEAGTETTPNAGGSFGLPAVGGIPGDSLEAAILERAHTYLQTRPAALDLQLAAPDLKAVLDDPNAANDPQILSVRSGADYAKGHIRGATNLGWKDAADLTKIGLIDPARPVVVYCYTGHTGSLATMALGMLGYDVVNLLYGMDGWNTSTSIGSGKLHRFDVVRGWDLPIDDGGVDDLGSLAAYAPPNGCIECHTSLTAILYDSTVNAPVDPDAPPSVGEG